MTSAHWRQAEQHSHDLALVRCFVYVQADRLSELNAATDAPVTPPQADAPGKNLAQQLAAGLRELADKVEAQPDLISKAADLMSLDFVDNRAPPDEVSTKALASFVS